MIALTYSSKESLHLVKQHDPVKWLATLKPFLKVLNKLRLLKQFKFHDATLLYCYHATSQANIIYALASHQHIMNKLNEYQDVCKKIAQYCEQLYAVMSAKDYSNKARGELTTYYQDKISTLTYKKTQLLLHDEVIAGLEVVSETITKVD